MNQFRQYHRMYAIFKLIASNANTRNSNEKQKLCSIQTQIRKYFQLFLVTVLYLSLANRQQFQNGFGFSMKTFDYTEIEGHFFVCFTNLAHSHRAWCSIAFVTAINNLEMSVYVYDTHRESFSENVKAITTFLRMSCGLKQRSVEYHLKPHGF